MNKLRGHYSRLLYRAVLNATKAALKQIKGRVGSRASVRAPSAPSCPLPRPLTSPPKHLPPTFFAPLSTSSQGAALAFAAAVRARLSTSSHTLLLP